MSVTLLTEHNLEFLRLKEDCTGSYESTLVKTPHCWKSHVTAHMNIFIRFDENPAMTLQDIKETKLYGRTDVQTHGRENNIPTTNKVCGGYNKNGIVCITRGMNRTECNGKVNVKPFGGDLPYCPKV